MTPLSPILFILMGCNDSDKNIGIINSPPSATITSHSDGAELPEYVDTTFVGTAGDADNSPDELLVKWTTDDNQELCPASAPDVDGTSTCVANLTPDMTKIIMTVTDPSNDGDQAEISITVIETETPQVEIVSPVADGVYYSNQLILFEGIISDEEDRPEDLTATWESSIDGVLSVDTEPNGDGVIEGYGNLSEGQHVIELNVADTSGKTNKETVIIDVGAPNSAPACAITAPEPGSAGREGESVTFAAEVSDPDVSPSTLQVEWSSDKDGVIGSSTPNASGSVNFVYADLSLNTHLISMKVTDDVGEECVADILYTVGSAPTITLTSPNDGDTFNQGDSITFSAEVSDSEDAPEAITLSWESSIDGVFSTNGAASNGIVQFTNTTLTGGEHSITVTATDSTGLFTQDFAQITVNGVPTQPTLTLAPDPAYTTDALIASASGSVDPEGSPVTYEYAWLQGGSTTSYTNSTLPNSATSRGEEWTVRVTPFDGVTYGPFAEASITISNSPPEVFGVAITPSNPSTQSDLVCGYSTSDADGDTVGVDIEWTMGSNVLSSTTDTLEGPFQMGDILTCTVTPQDGTDTGTPQSASVTISNTQPTISSLTLTPSMVYTEDIITANVSASDSDGDPLTYTWNWYVDSGNGFTVAQTTSGSNVQDTLDGVSFFDKDDQVYVTVDVSDGSGSVSDTSSTIIVQNTAPSAYNVVIDPAAPIAGQDDLTCVAQGSDIDGDNVTFTYAWNEDGVLSSYTTDTVPASDLADGAVWECVVTPDDGTDAGATNSDSVTVGADLPEATGSGNCAAAGIATDAQGNQFITCLGESGVAGVEGSDTSSNTWQPGSIYTFSPE